MPDRSHLIGAAILLLSGLIFASTAAFLFYGQTRLEQNGVATSGTVVTLVESHDDDGGVSYAPVVRFTTRGGRQTQFQSNFYSYPSDYKVGQSVTVLYPPDRPAEARIKGEGRLLMIIFGLVGGLELLAGIFLAGKVTLANLRSE